jgi:small subunit ribosomal protein S6
MRRYELMLVLRPDLADDKVQGTLERAARAIAAGGGQIVKQAPWGRRRLAYPIDHHREGSYYVILFEAPATAIGELERARSRPRAAMKGTRMGTSMSSSPTMRTRSPVTKSR